jgi:hypothetical protein
MNQELPSLEDLQKAQELIWPEELVTMTAEDYERKMICAEHERSLARRLEQATWEAYCQRHDLEAPQAVAMEPISRGFG